MTGDPFSWRSGGKRFDIGDDSEGGIHAMIPLDGDLLCVTTKSVFAIRLADSIDPKRTDPNTLDMKQKVFDHGSATEFVGRTLLQANTLFTDQALGSKFDNKKGKKIGFDFMKEISAIRMTADDLVQEIEKKNSAFEGRPAADGSLHLPSVNRLEQRVKQFIISVDHAKRHQMEVVQLFYPDIENKYWWERLEEKLKPAIEIKRVDGEFVRNFTAWTWQMRNLRNAIEHPSKDDKVNILDYRLTTGLRVCVPTIEYRNEKTPLQEMPISEFILITIENLLVSFEFLIAYLCNVHVLKFAGHDRFVVEIPVVNRKAHEAHVRFDYQIVW